MRLYLHIGSHKTGTTAIQHFAAHNRDYLEEHGLLYPAVGVDGAPAGRHHMAVFGGMFGLGGPSDLASAAIDDFFVRVRARANESGHDVLLSGENVFRLTYEQRDELYTRLRNTFPGFDIIAVVALRRQDNLADSLYRTVVRGEVRPTRVPPQWPEFLRSREGLFGYWPIVSQAEIALGSRPLLLPYDGVNRRDIIAALFAHLGVDVAEAQPLAKRVNVSFDYLDCGVKWMLHDLQVSEKTFRRFDGFAGANPSRSPYSFFDSDSRREFLDRYAAGNAALCAEFPVLNDVLSDRFEPDFAATPTEAAADEVARRFLDFYANIR